MNTATAELLPPKDAYELYIPAALASADPHLTPLLRAFGYALRVEVTI